MVAKSYAVDNDRIIEISLFGGGGAARLVAHSLISEGDAIELPNIKVDDEPVGGTVTSVYQDETEEGHFTQVRWEK